MQRILGYLRKAVNDYKMIEDGDKIAVGLSGGKDSILLVSALAHYRRFSDEKFSLVAINVDMGFSDVSEEEYARTESYLQSLDVPFYRVKTDIAEIIFDRREESSPCSLCSKMRRGALNTKAIELGANKIALGHHVDDALETLLLTFTHEGRLSTFAPYSYMDRTGITLIRPLIYLEEHDIQLACKRLELPIIFNPCPMDKHTRRQYIKELIDRIDEEIPRSKSLMISALIHPERNNLWDKWKK